MTKKLVMTKGLPGSGKSTWAKEQVRTNPGQWKRINKDDMRAMLDDSHHSKGNENFVLKARDFLVSEALKDGKHVIVDDTNFDPKHETRLRELAAEHNAHFEIKDFTHVDLETCIERDLKRFSSVGEKVIRGMYNKYLHHTTPSGGDKVHTYLPHDPNLPNAILVDVDGTLAMMHSRGPFDWKRVGEDLPHAPVVDMVRSFVAGYGYLNHWKSGYKGLSLIVVSGRDGSCRKETADWLMNNHIHFDDLFMRPEGDYRKDNIVKEEIFRNQIQGKYNVLFVVDDRDQVVQMWREIGLPCFQVAPGNF